MLSQRLTRFNIKSALYVLGGACKYCSEKQMQTHWRSRWKDRPDEWYSKLSLFQIGRGPSADWLTFIQTEIDLRPSSIKRWWKKAQEEMAIYDERFIPERHKILGGDLAAAHFIVHRGGRVKFYGNHNWICKNEEEEYDLPRFFDSAYCIEAIDASKMKIHFEGFGNLMDLYRIKWLSLEGCPNVDDWCLDRISGAFGDCLEHLDLRNCPKVTVRGLAALYRLRNLKKLLVSNDAGDKNVELACLMFEDILPNLEIEGITYLPLPDSTENPEKNDIESKRAL